MKILACILLPVLFLTACSHTYYVVRHAEKAEQEANMTSDVPLSEAGEARAESLRKLMAKKNIVYIFSTNTLRTMATVKPTAEHAHRLVQVYGPVPDAAFIAKLKSLKRNTLIVGHSNTVDDIVNGLTGTKSVNGDLKDDEYDNLFIIKIKGKKIAFQNQKFGKPTP